jgi:hypothetical protein
MNKENLNSNKPKQKNLARDDLSTDKRSKANPSKPWQQGCE